MSLFPYGEEGTVFIQEQKGSGHWYFETVDSPSEINTSMKIDWVFSKKWLINAYRGSDRPILIKMKPETFLEVSSLTHKPSKASIKNIKKGLKDGETFETPFIVLNRNNEVVGHEGRHRALVLWRMGEKEMPVGVIRRY